MQGERHPAKLAVTEAREGVLKRLSEALAKDELGLDEFEARVDWACQASTDVGLNVPAKGGASALAAEREEGS